jgi:hypothetical protein
MHPMRALGAVGDHDRGELFDSEGVSITAFGDSVAGIRQVSAVATVRVLVIDRKRDAPVIGRRRNFQCFRSPRARIRMHPELSR